MKLFVKLLDLVGVFKSAGVENEKDKRMFVSVVLHVFLFSFLVWCLITLV